MVSSLVRTIWVVTVQAAISAAAAQNVSAQEPTGDLLAAQIRDQGYRCDKPVSAQKNMTRSKPDSAVWVLRCKNSAYRLRLVPDMAARVERLK
jgi:hypothetical protein